MKPFTEFYSIDDNSTSIDWEGMDAEYSWLRKLRGGYIPDHLKGKGNVWLQDPYYHAEGDVWTHTRMVLDELIKSPDWYDVADHERFILFASVMLHDVMKPETYENINGRISNKGHSRMGANEARQILWKMNVPYKIREEICNIIAIHQVPFHLFNTDEQRIRKVITKASLSMSNRLLCMVARADMRGRIILPGALHTKDEAMDNITLYEEEARMMDCLDTPYQFYNEHSRRQYFISDDKLPDVKLFDTTSNDFKVYIMSGLPASGKSTIATGFNLPVVSMDDIRRELGMTMKDNQGIIQQEAKKRAKELLAAKQSFVWDGVNLDVNRRTPIVDMCCAYGARVILTYVETEYHDMLKRNRERDAMVPEDVIIKMMNKWSPPTLDEAHSLIVISPDSCYDFNVTVPKDCKP